MYLETEGYTKLDLLEVIDVLEKREDVEYAYLDFYMSSSSSDEGSTPSRTLPNDPNTNADSSWWIDHISLPEAWEIVTGTKNVSVAVIDTGISAVHQDLAPNVDTYLSRDFTIGLQNIEAYNPVVPVDTYGHGTHVAGIIGAKGNNNFGISGVAWDVDLVSLRTSTHEYHEISYVTLALDYAEWKGIDIVNMSLNWDHEYEENKLRSIIPNKYLTAFYNAFSSFSGLIVCSAGNCGINIDEEIIYPGSISELDNLLVVGNIDQNNELVYVNPNDVNNSNYGLNNVDIYAPGHYIYSTTNDGAYGTKNGTSQAAPFVTGVAALLKSLDSSLTPLEIKNTILNNCDTITINAQGEQQTVRKLNAYKAVSAISHEHIFVYQTYNNLTHKKICSCGKYTYENHVGVHKPGIIGLSCLYCNKLLDFGGGMGEGVLSNNIIATTENGSYKLSNGLIILNERDLLSYLNGTLIFIGKEDESQ